MIPIPPGSALPPWPMVERPGFLIRRLHQIHTSLFARRCPGSDITPVQYSLLSALALRGTADQTSLAADILLDRTTTTGALARLASRGLVERVRSSQDRRARECRLTREGAATLARMESAVRQAHEETVAALDPAEREIFLRLMNKVVASHGAEAADPPS